MAMKFKFDPNQEYQLQAIRSVVDLFEGQSYLEHRSNVSGLGLTPVVSNPPELDRDRLLENVQAVQSRNQLPVDSQLECIEATVDTAKGEAQVSFPNFTVEMETGTGKTYVYLRTALELFLSYGFRKFIVVVPSVAIREGVLKTLEITEEHFRQLYDNPTYRYYPYDSGNLSRVRQFALSDGLEIMVMTLAAFNKDANIIRQSRDQLQGEVPLYLVQATRPVLILDEPQNMESDKSRRALASLNPLFALRYSATHRHTYNLVYRLTPFEAYRQGLVKRIEVAGVEQAHSEMHPFIRLDSISADKRTVRARLTVHKLLRNGTVKPKRVTVRLGDSLEAKTNRSDYSEYVVDEISKAGGYVRFTNGLEIRIGEETGVEREALWEAQIRYAIREHFIKQRRLLARGIKVLSLFFIDRVANYADEDGIIRRLFDRCFREVSADYPDVCQRLWGRRDVDPAEVRAAYFAQRRTREGTVVYEDSVTGEAERDRETYDLIMRDKERLLSLAEPVAFIFSHSALREGWDNPNIFQICTLNQTASEIKKRQEIGRGIRLAVDQQGNRVHDEHVNILTVVANESYEHYVATLQSEYAEEFAEHERPPRPPDARRRRAAKLRKAYLLSPEFEELWERIKHKTRYAVAIDTDRLITEVVEELDQASIPPPQVQVTKVQVEMADEDGLQALQVTGARTLLELSGRFPLPNLVWLMEDLMERTTPPMRLSRRTLLEIFRRTKIKEDAVRNPHEFARIATAIIKQKLAEQLVEGIRYEKTGEWYEMTQFEALVESWDEYLVPADKSLYDRVLAESEVERKFVEGLEQRRDVKLYVKLPAWFTVPTPIGEYNPDWAIVVQPCDEHGEPTGDETLYLVRETKSTTNLDELRPEEAVRSPAARASAASPKLWVLQ